MAKTTTLNLTGRPSDRKQLPVLLQSTRRSADGAEAADDPFLPPDYLQLRASFDVGAAVRGGAASAQQYEAQDDEVLVLELADGGVLITSAGKLKAALQRSRPELLGADGDILFDRLRGDAAARGAIGDAVGGLVSKVFALAVGTGSDAIIDAARDKLVELGQGGGGEKQQLGVSWLGTREAEMIEGLCNTGVRARENVSGERGIALGGGEGREGEGQGGGCGRGVGGVPG
ncbi:hypothetical protein [Candidatus Accumulibacter sp. ACC003]|uniref:hypothetical protein n=1 Tax=Candidatus Accumulibacter sp. ACC003 TaxID=2823334 RepID=UPI0025B8B98B|nr:hypothetical protein [Candidatus Accumulibacter sp. ACC003]